MPTGTVKFVNSERGYGFISRDDKQPKVFLHISEVLRAGFEAIEKGQRWTFDLKTDQEDRVQAVNLRPGDLERDDF